jgi:hypothetical protein
MADHAWCRDVARDAAVRAAEDGRTQPLPTLEECIETAFSAGVRDSFRKVGEAWAMIPKSVSASSPVDQENKGDGMSTERITLEVTHDDNDGHIQFRNWDQMLFGEQNGVRFPGESVRVVEEELSDAWAQRLARLTAERDAAIRERDDLRKSWLRSEESGTRLLAERNAALDAADGLRKRVAELEAASGGGEGEPVAWRVEYRGFIELYSVEQFATERASEVRGTVVPLYRSPPQPRGWLTEEEREAVQWAADAAYDKQHPAEDTLRNILARSTPPEVVLPDADCSWCSDYATVWRECLEAVRSSLAAAGVAVKEVSSE